MENLDAFDAELDALVIQVGLRTLAEKAEAGDPVVPANFYELLGRIEDAARSLGLEIEESDA